MLLLETVHLLKQARTIRGRHLSAPRIQMTNARFASRTAREDC
jgi:hypothetical protein